MVALCPASRAYRSLSLASLARSAAKIILMRFLGINDDINVATQHSEFFRWRWVQPNRVVDLIVAFKRHLYEEVLQQLSRYIT
jgi:hypothetical protein